MITIKHAVVRRFWDANPNQKWMAYCCVNCHGIAEFEALYPGPTRHYVRGARNFLQRMAERTAEWWELDNYPCIEHPSWL